MQILALLFEKDNDTTAFIAKCKRNMTGNDMKSNKNTRRQLSKTSESY